MHPIVQDALRYRAKAKTAKRHETRVKNTRRLNETLSVMTAKAAQQYVDAIHSEKQA